MVAQSLTTVARPCPRVSPPGPSAVAGVTQAASLSTPSRGVEDGGSPWWRTDGLPCSAVGGLGCGSDRLDRQSPVRESMGKILVKPGRETVWGDGQHDLVDRFVRQCCFDGVHR